MKYPYLRRRRDNFKCLLEDTIRRSSCRFVMFSPDDAIFYKEQVIGKDVYDLILSDPRSVTYRCYVGRNHSNSPQTLQQEGAFLKWNYYDPVMYSHWAYPFACDGTIYEKKALLSVIGPALYHMPSTLEANIVSNVRAKRLFARGYSPVQSSMVVLEINCVQTLVNNAAASFDVAMLNHYYMEGYLLKVELPTQINSNAFIPKTLTLTCGGDEVIISEKGIVDRQTCTLSHADNS
jgi:hypothetical protein